MPSLPAKTEKGKENVSAAAEAVDDESSKESSREAPATGGDDEDEESSPEAPVEDVAEDDKDEESSPEAPNTEQERAESSPAAAQPISSEESSDAKIRSQSPPDLAKNGSRAAVPKVPLSRAHGSSGSPVKPEETAQQVIAARKRKLRSEGPVEKIGRASCRERVYVLV